MKLWQKDTASLKEVEVFTVGRDREFDLMLAPFDILGSIAHVTMLESVGLLTAEEKDRIIEALREIYKTTSPSSSVASAKEDEASEDKASEDKASEDKASEDKASEDKASEDKASEDEAFTIHPDVEDVHSQVELLLTRKLGDAGKKIHSARSRNDQVLVDVKLFLRHELEGLVKNIQPLFELLQAQSEKYKNHLLPGYTHLQLAMPSSFGLWFGAYAESLVDDLVTVRAAYEVVNKNPLGSAAGYGSSFPINRTLTTRLLGFETMNYNVVYAQMGRGKAERIVAQALANVAETLAKLSMDACLYLNQNFGFISFPAELTTGSSIMPHKKNPDVFELIRSHCNRIKALPNEISMMTTNLPSGYHRDLQLLKEHLFPAFKTLKDCIEMTGLMLSNIEISKDILADEKYKYLFSVEEVNKLVNQGLPFRDAYKKVGRDIEAGQFTYDTSVNHTHEGSIGNLCTTEIKAMMDQVLNSFPFDKVNAAVGKLVNGE